MIQRTACLIALKSDPYRNQAIEKHLMDTLPEKTAILYLWQNEKTLLLGRCQNPWYVCAVDRFTLSGGEVARRLSGGRDMYADGGSVGATLLLPKAEWDVSRQMAMLGMAVGAFGIQAHSAPGCGLAVSGRRFCENAFFKSGSAAIHQSVLLCEAGLGALAKAKEIEAEKLPQTLRVPPDAYANLADLSSDATADRMREALYWAFGRVYGSQPAMLDERMLDSASIEWLTGCFSNREWIFPPSAPYTFSVAERFPWGGVSVQLAAEGGVIRQARIYTDAMEAALMAQIERALVGSPFLISAISGRLGQKLGAFASPRLNQIAGDLCTLICGRIRAMDRSGGK